MADGNEGRPASQAVRNGPFPFGNTRQLRPSWHGNMSAPGHPPPGRPPAPPLRGNARFDLRQAAPGPRPVPLLGADQPTQNRVPSLMSTNLVRGSNGNLRGMGSQLRQSGPRFDPSHNQGFGARLAGGPASRFTGTRMQQLSDNIPDEKAVSSSRLNQFDSNDNNESSEDGPFGNQPPTVRHLPLRMFPVGSKLTSDVRQPGNLSGEVGRSFDVKSEFSKLAAFRPSFSSMSKMQASKSQTETKEQESLEQKPSFNSHMNLADSHGHFKDNSFGGSGDTNQRAGVHSTDISNLDPQQRALLKLASSTNAPSFGGVQPHNSNQSATSDQQPLQGNAIMRLQGPELRPLGPPSHGQVRPGSFPLSQHQRPPVDQGPRPVGDPHQPGFGTGDRAPRPLLPGVEPSSNFFPPSKPTQELRLPAEFQPKGPAGEFPPQGFRPPGDMPSRGPPGNFPPRGFGPPADRGPRGPIVGIAPRGFEPPGGAPPCGPSGDIVPQRFGFHGETMPRGPPPAGLTPPGFKLPGETPPQISMGDAVLRGFGPRVDVPPHGLHPLGPMPHRFPGQGPPMQTSDLGQPRLEPGSSQNGPPNSQPPQLPSGFGNTARPFGDGNQLFQTPLQQPGSEPRLSSLPTKGDGIPNNENFRPGFNTPGMRPNFQTADGQKPFFNDPGQSFGTSNNYNQFNSETKMDMEINSSSSGAGFGVQSGPPQRPQLPPGGSGTLNPVRPLMHLETQAPVTQLNSSNISSDSSHQMSRPPMFPPPALNAEVFVSQPPAVPPALVVNNFSVPPPTAATVLPPPIRPVPPVGPFIPPMTVPPPPFGLQAVNRMPNLSTQPPSMLPPPAMPVPPPMMPALGFQPSASNTLLPPFGLPPPFYTVPPPVLGVVPSPNVVPAANSIATLPMTSNILPASSSAPAATTETVSAKSAPSSKTTDLSASDLPLWVETKTADGKVYYYNAESRESSWARPENSTIITQLELESLAANQSSDTDGSQSANDKVASSSASQLPESTTTTVATSDASKLSALMTDVTNVVPSGVVASEPTTQKRTIAAAAPLQTASEDKLSAVISTGSSGSGTVLSDEPNVPTANNQLKTVTDELEPAPVKKCDWSEHFNTDGRPYYYNSDTLESVWHKPQALSDWQAHQTKLAQADAKLSAAVPSSSGKSDTSDTTANNTTSVSSATTATTTAGDKTEKSDDKISDDKTQSQSPDDDSSEEDDASDDKSRPVSSTPVPGTPWCVVWTGDDRVFFFNPSQNQSVWDCPEELENRSDVKKLLQTPPSVEQQQPTANASDAATSKAGVASGAKVRKATDEGDAQAKRAKLAQDDVIIVHKSSRRALQQIKAGRDSAMEAEMKAAQERAMVPQEVRVQQFMEMLTEKQVSVFSTWEKELHKIVFDKRYLLLPSKERKQVYEQYIRERADEERREKSKKLRQRKDDFKQMLSEVKIPSRMSFSEFAARYGRDERFKAIEKMRDRELMFNEFTAENRQRRDVGGDLPTAAAAATLQSDKMKADFTQMLRETSNLSATSAWIDVRPRFESDHRYRTVPSNSMREEWFRDYCNLLDKETDDERRLRDKQERMFASLREREMAVKQSLSASLRDRDREREQHLKKEAVQHFTALMADMVRNADMSWRDTRKMLHDDSRWKLTKLLDKTEKQALFEEHMLALNRRNRDMFRRLIDEHLNAAELFTVIWKDLRKMIKDDPRFGKFSSSDRKREKAFDEYRQEKLVQAKIDYRELLKETKQITYKSAKQIRESEQHLREITRVLENDQRHLMLDCVADERHQILMSYIDDIERKGQPPPPTATDPGRRTNK